MLESDRKSLAPQVGLEPTTLRLTAECSAIELLRNIGMRRRSTLPGRYQPSTIDVLRLNFCVRYGNRWNPQAIATAKGEQIWCFALPGHCLRSVSGSHSSLPVALLCEISQPSFALGFAQAPTGCTLSSVAAKGELCFSCACFTAALPRQAASHPDNRIGRTLILVSSLGLRLEIKLSTD